MSAEFITLDPILRGDYEIIDFELSNPDGTPRNLAGKTLTFSAKQRMSDDTYFFQKTIGDGITVIDEEAGTGIIEFDGSETTGLSKATTLYCDMEEKDLAGRPSTTLYKLPVKLDVTTNA